MTIASRAYAIFVRAAALLCFGLALFSPAMLRDGDTFMHIAAGGWMLDHHRLATTDPFSFTAAGQPWVSHEWLSEIVMALAYRAGGWPGLLLPFAAAFAACVLLLGLAARRWLDPLPAAILVFAAMSTTMPSLLARPHLFVLPIMAAWAMIVLTARSQSRAPHWAAALLLVPWVNLHGSFFVGLAFAAAAAVEAWLQSPGARAAVARAWGGFLLACVVATLATPHGIAGLLLPFHLVAMPALQKINEWAPLDFAKWPPIMIPLLALLYFGLAYGPRLPKLRVALVLVLIEQALLHGRNQMLFGIFGLLVLAEPLGRYFRGSDTPPPSPALASPPERGVPVGSRVIWLVGAAVLLAVRIAFPVQIGDDDARPVSALAHLPTELADQPVLNGYGFGSYLIFRGIRPYIDGRVELYGNAFLQHYLDMTKPDHALLAQTLAQDHIAWTLFSARSATADMMDLMPGWKRLYADRTAVIHVRAAP